MSAVEGACSIVGGEVVEVLHGHGLAHVHTTDGRLVGITRKTPGVVFDLLRPGQKLRCRVTDRFHRVLHANALG